MKVKRREVLGCVCPVIVRGMSYRSRQPTIQSALSAANAERINQRAFLWVWGRKEELKNHLVSASEIAGLLPECQESPAIGEGSLQHRLLWPPWIFKGMHWVGNISSLEHCGKRGAEFAAGQAACLHVLLSFRLMWGTHGSALKAGHMSQCCWWRGAQPFHVAAASLVAWALGEPCHVDLVDD